MTDPRSSERSARQGPPDVGRRADRALPPGAEAGRVALVVDDEPLVRSLVSKLLRLDGWSVIEAPDAGTALELAPARLDLLVTDFEMPRVSGLVLAGQLRLSHAALPVLMVSGHGDVADTVASLGWPRTAFVGKPFGVETLMSTIGSITH